MLFKDNRIYFFVLVTLTLCLFSIYVPYELATKDGYNTNLVDAYLRDSRVLSALLAEVISKNFSNDIDARYLGLAFFSLTLSSFVFSVSRHFFTTNTSRVVFGFLFVFSIFSNSLLYIYVAVFWTAGLAFFLATISFECYINRHAKLYILFSSVLCSFLIMTYQIIILLPVGFVFLASIQDRRYKDFITWLVFFIFSIAILMLVLRSDYYINNIGSYRTIRPAINLLYLDSSLERYARYVALRFSIMERLVEYRFLFLSLLSLIVTFLFYSSLRNKIISFVILVGVGFVIFNPLILMNASFNGRAYSTVLSIVLVFLFYAAVSLFSEIDNNASTTKSITIFTLISSIIFYLAGEISYYIFLMSISLMIYILSRIINNASSKCFFSAFITFSLIFTFQVRLNYLDQFKLNYDLSKQMMTTVNTELAFIKRKYPKKKIVVNVYYGDSDVRFYNLNNSVSGEQYFKKMSLKRLIDDVLVKDEVCPIDEGDRHGLVSYTWNARELNNVIFDVCF